MPTTGGTKSAVSPYQLQLFSNLPLYTTQLDDGSGQAADADERQTQNRIRGIQQNQDHLLAIFQEKILLQ